MYNYNKGGASTIYILERHKVFGKILIFSLYLLIRDIFKWMLRLRGHQLSGKGKKGRAFPGASGGRPILLPNLSNVSLYFSPWKMCLLSAVLGA